MFTIPQSLSTSVPPHLFLKALSLIVIFPLTVPLLTGDRGPHHSLVILEDAKLTLQVLEHLDNDIYDGANIWCKYQISNILIHLANQTTVTGRV